MAYKQYDSESNRYKKIDGVLWYFVPTITYPENIYGPVERKTQQKPYYREFEKKKR